MRVIFLDMDGVVNSHRYLERNEGQFEKLSKRAARRKKGAMKASARQDELRWICMIDPEAVVHLNAIISATGAVCVLSSSWRIAQPFDKVERHLVERGFAGRIIDATPNGTFIPKEWEDRPSHEYARGLEIAEWLDRHPEVESFVILDDSADMAYLLPKLVRTSWASGLGAEHVEQAVKMLLETR